MITISVIIVAFAASLWLVVDTLLKLAKRLKPRKKANENAKR